MRLPPTGTSDIHHLASDNVVFEKHTTGEPQTWYGSPLNLGIDTIRHQEP